MNALFITIGIFIGIFLLMLIFLFIFWITMIIDCCKRKFEKGEERLIWLLILLFTNLIGTLVYYFLIGRYNPQGILDKEGHFK
jgi:hypothetical protein